GHVVPFLDVLASWPVAAFASDVFQVCGLLLVLKAAIDAETDHVADDALAVELPQRRFRCFHETFVSDGMRTVFLVLLLPNLESVLVTLLALRGADVLRVR